VAPPGISPKVYTGVLLLVVYQLKGLAVHVDEVASYMAKYCGEGLLKGIR
jgi:hypothetical protein